MSSAAPTPSPSAKHASLTSCADDPPEHEAGRVADPLDVAAERGEERLGRARRRARGRRAARELDQTAERHGGEEAGGAALGVELGERRLVAQHDLRAALERDPCSSPPQSTTSAGTLALRLLRVGDPPARLAGRSASASASGEKPRDHDEPAVAAARLRRGRVVGAVRALLGVLVPAAPGLAAEVARGDLARGEHRRSPARLAEGLGVERLRDLEADVDRRRGPSARTAPSGSRRRGGRRGRPARASPAPPARAAAPRGRTAGRSG